MYLLAIIGLLSVSVGSRRDLTHRLLAAFALTAIPIGVYCLLITQLP